MQNIYSNRKRQKRIAIFLLTFLIVSLAIGSTAFALGNGAIADRVDNMQSGDYGHTGLFDGEGNVVTAPKNNWTTTDDSDINNELQKYGKQIEKIYNLFTAVALPCACVCFAFGAFKMLMGDEKEASTGKTIMKFAILGIFAILVLPSAIGIGIDVGKTYGWTPPGG